MSISKNETELGLLGLEGATPLLKAELFVGGDLGVDRGAGLASVAMLLALPSFEAVELAGLGDFGFSVATSPQVSHHLEVSAPDSLILRSERPGELWRLESDSSSSVRFDIRERGAVVIERTEGPALVLLDRGDRVQALVVESPSTVVLGADLEAWTDGIRDAWMLAQIGSTRSSDGWATLRVIGRFARLAELHATPEERRAAVRRLLEGRLDPRHEGPRKWAGGWSQAQRDQVRRWTLGRVEALVGQLRQLGASVDPFDPDWRRLMLRTLVERDDVEGVCLLLVEGGDEPEVVSALRSADELGEHLARDVEGEVCFHDTQLERACGIELHRPWWTRFSESA